MVTTGWSGLVEKFLTEEEKQIITDEYNRIAATPNTSVADRNKVLSSAYFYALHKMNQLGKPIMGMTQGNPFIGKVTTSKLKEIPKDDIWYRWF